MPGCKFDNGLEIYFLVICLVFNVLNLLLYFRIGWIKCKRLTTKSQPNAGQANQEEPNQRKPIPKSIHYILNRDIEDDVAQVHSVGTISAYSTNMVRGNQALLAVAMSTSFFLMALNIYYNTVVAPSDPSNIDAIEWIILICYSVLALVGLFPSCTVVTKTLPPDLQSDNPDDHSMYLREWNILLCTTVNVTFSGWVHVIASIIYLIPPTCINIYLNSHNMSGHSDLYLGFACTSLIVSVLFLLVSIILIPLERKWKNEAQGPYAPRAKDEMLWWHYLSYTIELVAFPLATTQYILIELNSILQKCSV